MRALITCATICLSSALGLTACSDDVQPDNNATKNNKTTPDLGMDLDTPDVAPDADMSLPKEDMDTIKPDMVIKPIEDMSSPWDFGPPVDMGPPSFKLLEVIPPQGPLDGGNQLRITGQGLIDGTTIFMGSRQMAVEVVGQNLIGYAPAGTTPGPVTIKAISPDGRTSILPDAYTYLTTLRFDSISPSRVPTTGGVEVEILGEGFVQQTTVSFSGTSALRVEVIDNNRLRAITPPRARGFVDVRLTTPSASIVAPSALEYFEPLRLDRVDPASGPSAGGQRVTLYGEGFNTQARVMLDGVTAQIEQINPTQNTITLTTPPHPSGLVDITIEQDAQSARLSNAYLYRNDDAPTLAAIRPNFGPEDGGQEVTLTGVGLDHPNARFVFGDKEATIQAKSATTARVLTPANTVGKVDVIFYQGTDERGRLVQAYDYRPGLWLDQLSPAQGPVEGGTKVTLQGRGLLGVERVSFGGLPAQFTITSDTAIEATSPVHSAGPVTVSIERAGLTANLIDGYTYTEPLEIWGFSPTRGSIAGGTFIQIRGRGFYGALEASLANSPATGLRRLDSHNLSLYSPPNPTGDAQLRVKNAQAQANGPYPFEYFNPASRFGGATGTPINGAVNVSVFDLGGSPIPNAFVMLSTRPDTRYQGLTNEIGLVTLSGAEVLGAQSVTATAAGYSTATVQAVDAENITIFLNQLDPRPGEGGNGQPPPFATISGRVSTLGKLADPAKTRTYDMAVVRTTSPSPYGGNLNPGPGGLIIGGVGDYEITTRVGDMAIVVLCGVYDQDTQQFSPQYMGVRRFLFVSDQDQLTGINVDCDIPLDAELQVKLVNTVYNPDGPNNNVVTAIWNFGFEGYFQSPTNARGLGELLTLKGQPASTGILADLVIDMAMGSYTELYSPYTQTQVTGVKATGQPGQLIIAPPLLDVPEAVSPLSGGVVINNELRWQANGPYFPSLYIVSIRNERGISVWTMVTPGTATSVRLPQFPDFSALPPEQRPWPYQQGTLFLSLTAARIPNFSFDQFTYEDLNSTRWEASAVARWPISFAP